MTRRSKIIATAATVACVPVGFAGATAVVGTPVTPRAGVVTDAGGYAGVAGSESIERVTPDLAAGGTGKPWALTVFKAHNGQTCAAPGRKQGNAVGSVNPDGSVTPYPIEDSATCVDLRDTPAGVQVTSGQEGTSVHGIAGRRVRRIIITFNGTRRAVRIGRRGAFLAVLGAVEFDAVGVTAIMRDGRRVVLL